MTAFATITPLDSGGAVLDLGDIPEWFDDPDEAKATAELLGVRWVFTDSPADWFDPPRSS